VAYYPCRSSNNALARRSWEIVTETNLDTVEDDLKEVYADTFVMHEPDEDVHGIEGLTLFVSTIRSAFTDLSITLEDEMPEGTRLLAVGRDGEPTRAN